MTWFDPQAEIGALRDDAPLVLLPLRLETRFRPARTRPRRAAELWVRVYPDDCWVDTFAPELTATEFESVRTYWRARFAAPDETGVRAAWRALVQAHGAGRSSYLVELWQPADLAEVDAADPAALVGRDTSWSRAARVQGFPQRLRLVAMRGGAIELDQLGELIPDPLIVGPDPSAPPGSGIHIDESDGRLVVPDELQWLVDFERALASGMAFRVPLNADQAAVGFDRLFVVGIRLGGDEDSGAKALAELIEHQRWSSGGFELLPQGTPTNNTDGAPARFRRFDDADFSFDAVHRAAAPRADPADWRHKPDGQWFTELLGLDPELATHVVNAEGTDQVEARAMNLLLWPGTLGYYLDALLAVAVPGRGARGLLSREAERDLRLWFTRYVLGRGTLPAIRVGRQPYGLVATTAYSRISWTNAGPPMADSAQLPLVAGVHRVLDSMRRDWTGLTAHVAHLRAGGGDAEERLAAVLGLEPASVQFHQRHVDNAPRQTVLLGYLGAELAQRHGAFVASAAEPALALLRELGADVPAPPEVLTKVFLGAANRLDGPVVDDIALSETNRLRPVGTSDANYVRWLLKAATSSLDELRTGAGLVPTPRALLYLLAKFALERGYAEAADDVLVSRGGADPAALGARRIEPAFVHVASGGESESRWRPLYEPAPRSTGDDSILLHEFVTRELRRRRLAGNSLADQVAALRDLDVPTARLERAFVEHLDTCGYRLDAWLAGLVGFQLQQMRFPVATRPARTGAHVGAYGWLEHVRPREAQLEPVTIDDPDVAATYADPGAAPLLRDPASGGFAAAPSLDHAATAAVLRAGYLSTADAATPGALAIDLSSERVRHAQVLLEGVRTGQPLGALLGYRLERGLHDRHDLPQLHTAIYALREAFPLRANRLADTVTAPGTPAEVIEARNVVDGQRLLDHVRAGGSLPPLAAPLAAAVTDEVGRLFELYDAVSDLAVAESVHQLVLGNHDRAAATLDAFGRAGLPPDPAVVHVPRRGFGITHRLALHLDPDAPAGPTPRSAAEPALDAWLEGVLPPADKVGCLVRAVNPETGVPAAQVVTQAQLGWRPIDLLLQLDVEADQVMAALDDAVVEHVLSGGGLRPDAHLAIKHTEPVDGMATFFQLAPVVRSLRSLLLDPTLLRPTDVLVPGAAASAVTPTLARARVAGPLAELVALRDEVAAFVASLESDADAAIATIHTTAAAALALGSSAARFGIGAAGTGQIRASLARAYAAVVAEAASTVATLVDREARFDVGLAAFDALPVSTPEAVRVERLLALERLVSTVATSPVTTVVALRAAVVAKRAVLGARRAAIVAATSGQPGLRSLLDGVTGAIVSMTPPLAELTGETPDLGAHSQGVATIADDLLRQARAVRAEADRRVEAAETALAEHDAAVDPAAAAGALQAAGRAVFGAGFPMIPTLTLAPAAAAELGAATSGSGALLAPLVAGGRDDPAGDWLHGVARVRERVQHLETVVLLADPLRRRCGAPLPPESALGLVPLQLPHVAGEPWLALELPPGTVSDHDVVCYTAVGEIPDTTRVCGLVVDEWPEVIALPDRTAGVAVHFDRPSSEPAQAWLVVSPATWDGRWSWDDVVHALDDTLDLAHIRAVEPDHIDASRYAPFLPATMFPVAPYQISIVANLALNTELFAKLRED